MKPKNTSIKVDFFKVNIGGAYSHLEDLIKYIESLADDESRSLKLGEYAVIRLQEALHENDFYKGDMVRIKMDDIPIKASGHTSKTEPIQLTNEEGIGTGTAFLYHVPSAILLLQRPNCGVTSDNFARYFQDLTLQSCAVNLLPIADSDVLRRVGNMKTIKRFNLKLSHLENKTLTSQSNPSVSAALDLNEFYDAPQIGIEMSVGRSRTTGLNKPKVMESIEKIVRGVYQGASIKGQVVGIDLENQPETVDLLGILMRIEIPVSYPGRVLLYNTRKNALIEAWVKKKDELKVMYDKIT